MLSDEVAFLCLIRVVEGFCVHWFMYVATLVTTCKIEGQHIRNGRQKQYWPKDTSSFLQSMNMGDHFRNQIWYFLFGKRIR